MRKTKFDAKNILIGLLALMLVAIISNAFVHPSLAAAPRIYLDPHDNTFPETTPVGTKFNVTVWVGDSPDIGGAQVYLEFNDDIINVTRWFVPSLSDSNFFYYGATKISTLPDPPDPGYIHVGVGHGCVKVAVLNGYLPPVAPWGHNGTIAIFEFNITKGPPPLLSSVLKINTTDTYLLDPDGSEVLGVAKEDASYTIIPEFLPLVALSLFIALTAAVVLLRKKKIVQRLN